MAEEKEHKPSDKKKDKARKDGQIIRSQVLVQAIVFFVSIVLLYFLSQGLADKFSELVNICWYKGSSNYSNCIERSGSVLFQYSSLFLCLTCILGIMIEIYIIGWKVDFSHLSPKAKNFSVVSGFKKIFCSWSELYQLFLKMTLCVITAYSFFSNNFINFIKAFNFDSSITLKLSSSLLSKSLFYMATAWLVIGVYDYYKNYKRYYKNLSMSEDEVRREHKDSEGDPQIKAQRRYLHEELLMSDVVKRIKGARVLIVEKV